MPETEETQKSEQEDPLYKQGHLESINDVEWEYIRYPLKYIFYISRVYYYRYFLYLLDFILFLFD